MFPTVSMSAHVLRFKWEIDNARRELKRRGLSSASTWWQDTLRCVGGGNRVKIGDHRKSWDVLKTAAFLEERVSESAPVLDIGEFASELVCGLHRLWFANRVGVYVDARGSVMAMAGVQR